jgi:hypothetical protein
MVGKKYPSQLIMPSSVLQPGLLMVEEGIYYGPKNTNYEVMVMTDDALRSQTTSRNNKYYADKSYDFPDLYIVDPVNKFLTWDPTSTYSMYQSMSYAKRYPTDK